MRKSFVWFIVVAVFALGMFALTSYGNPSTQVKPAESARAEGPVKAVCENGIMLGKSVDGVISFKGIPFAKPPVGELRWKAPQAPDPCDDEIECFDFGYTALQYEWPSEPASYSPKSEDCLTLNIWGSFHIRAES